MKVDRKRAEKSLSDKGFRKELRDHVFFYHQYAGEDTGIYTYTSHSKDYKDIGPDNLKKMKMQLQLETTRQVVNLLECPMSEADYLNHLIDRGIIVPDVDT